jgi:hypothetical protein
VNVLGELEAQPKASYPPCHVHDSLPSTKKTSSSPAAKQRDQSLNHGRSTKLGVRSCYNGKDFVDEWTQLD